MSMTKTIPVIATIAIAAILIGSVFGTTQTFNTAEAHTIPDKKIDKSFILCAVETGEQPVYPDNDLSSGVTNEESWTFILLPTADEDEDGVPDSLTVVAEMDFPAGVRDHPTGEDAVNGQDHDGDHFACDPDAVAAASAPGPSISVDFGDVVEITLVSDIN